MKQKDISIDSLWDSTPPATDTFDPNRFRDLPEAARRYLENSIAPVTPLATSVRLSMHGEINLNRWLPFQAEQIIRWDRGMIWKANVRMAGLPIKGFDRVLDGEARLKWKLLGLLPVLNESGPDISRSSIGRMGIEAVWLPSVFCRPDTKWSSYDNSLIKAEYPLLGEMIKPELKIGSGGQLQTVKIKRWGRPGEGEFRYEDFGGIAEAEKTISGYTIPTVLRVGWYFGTGRFESEGEFFRVVIDHARFL
jgi:hypothetical protein